MSQTWFTSDLHLGHANIIKYCNRPFANVQEMDEALIENWNARIKPADLVYVLGDFALVPPQEVAPRYVSRLHGTKQLIYGNHDRFLKDKRREFGFAWVGPYKEIKVSNQLIVMCHYPFMTWRSSHRGSWSLHGHSHGSLARDMTCRRLDVGVDPNGYKPLSYEEVAQEMAKVVFKPVDHHDL